MVRIETNLNEVALSLTEYLLDDDERSRRALMMGVHDAVGLISMRIQQDGQDAEGDVMTSDSAKTEGAYSKPYARKRKAAGRQIAQVDLTMTGDLMRNFQVIDVSSKEATAGFLASKQGDKAEYLEAYYGPVFGLTKEEGTMVADVVVDELFRN
jgi:hypothetical protein